MANELRDWRVKTILLEMVGGTWARTKRAALAEQWDVSIQTVEEYTRAAETAAMALASPDAPVMRANMGATLEMIRERALSAADLGAALNACAQYAKLYGLNAPEKRELDVKLPTSPEEAIARVKQILAENPELADVLH